MPIFFAQKLHRVIKLVLQHQRKYGELNGILSSLLCMQMTTSNWVTTPLWPNTSAAQVLREITTHNLIQETHQRLTLYSGTILQKYSTFLYKYVAVNIYIYFVIIYR